MSQKIEYVYCVVPADIDATDAPRGIDRAGVRAVANGPVAALATSLDAAEYSDDASAERMQNTEWLTPRAVAHDAVVVWAGDRGPVVPFPMCVLFTNESAISSMLAEKQSEFSETLARVSGAREFCVRISADRDSLAAAAEQMDSELAALDQRAGAAPPGEAYLLRRKLAEARKAATRDAAVRIAEQVHDALAASARSNVARATAVAREPGVILDGAYLVADERYEPFRATLTELMGIYEPAGLQFDFTGPWPPYHFVRGD